jgi:predicted HTH domain antitoxin
MAFRSDLEREAAVLLVLRGQTSVNEVAKLAHVSPQGVAFNLPDQVDRAYLQQVRQQYLWRLWRETLREVRS